MRASRLLAAVALAIAVAVVCGQAEKEDGDRVTIAPTIVTVAEVRAERGELICEELVLRQVPVEKTVKVRTGDKEVAVRQTVLQSETKALRTKYALKNCELYTVGGRRLGDEEASKQLTGGRTLLVSVGGKPARKYLQILREGTLVLVSKSQGVPLNPDPVPRMQKSPPAKDLPFDR